jgi:hypothetical protein
MSAMSEDLRSLTCHGRDGMARTFWYEVERDEIYPDAIRFRGHKSKPARMVEESWSR